ncbi:MAG: NYN domain-containing protein, partial [Desulfobacteraceae bacterium]|nr:NYN domain-containing protein [Desulfobacteraceae bacterium]
RPGVTHRGIFLSFCTGDPMGRKVSFFIDGFNVYHSLKPFDQNTRQYITKYMKYLWLDFMRLANRFVKKNDQLSEVFYFTALAYWRPESEARHKIFISALENAGVKVIRGKFKEKDRYCKFCGASYKHHEEKQTDVNIAVHLLNEAYKNTYDKAIILTNDTDLIPAIQVAKSSFPSKRFGVLFPIDRWSSELRTACDFWLKIHKKDLKASQFPDKVHLPNGVTLTRPANWR